MPSVVDVAEVNRISRRLLANAAAAIAGMVTAAAPPGDEDKPLVVAHAFAPVIDNVHLKDVAAGRSRWSGKASSTSHRSSTR
ncbi:hypothetical protein E1269_23555 [Jiangella asiatica]|uniref:UPF0261 domain-containing protein n=2 Tax=Jiangella asiatica TaxID=2530372 RepID=A0A4R5CTT7_9ACTN|nr:Tm-1-like ATP-binding domain-containing protein [Jiangella asiatica]TDE01143.1 hypothetical protein E1269_23555 [Jiangella asiatica]